MKTKLHYLILTIFIEDLFYKYYMLRNRGGDGD